MTFSTTRQLIRHLIIALALPVQAWAATPPAVPAVPAAVAPSAAAPPVTPAKESSSKAAPLATPPPSGMVSPARGGMVSVTRVIGEVNKRFVTSREVRINDAIEQAMSDKPSDPAAGFRILTGQESNFSRFVSIVLDEWAVYLEAKSLSVQASSQGDAIRASINRITKTVQDKWGSQPSWRQLEVSSDELREMIERKVVVQNFVRLKADPQTVPVTDDDALAYYKQNRLRFGSLPFSSFKENIKSYLIKQQTERRLADWLEVLRRRYKVRNFISG